MSKIRDILTRNEGVDNLKIRYKSWSTTKFFLILHIDNFKNLVFGQFDDGEASTFKMESDFWEEYYPGAESSVVLV